MIKRVLAGLFVALFLLSVAGCSSINPPPTSTDSSNTSGATTTLSVETRTRPAVAGYAYRFFTQVTSDNEELVGIMDSVGNVTCEPRFAVNTCRQLASNRFMVSGTDSPLAIVNEHGEIIIAITDGMEVQDNICSLDLYEAKESASIPVRFYVNGYVYDEDGNVLSEKYEKMRRADQGERPLVWALCAEGLFLLDENGQRMEQLDIIKEEEKLFSGMFIKTASQGFEFMRYGVRTADNQIILEERYQTVYPLSADRFVGADTAIAYTTDADWTEAVIVDGNGTVLCDRYQDIEFVRTSDGVYFPFGIASWVEHLSNGDAEARYAIIDWNGTQISEGIVAVGYSITDDGVLSLEQKDGSVVKYSAETGKPIE